MTFLEKLLELCPKTLNKLKTIVLFQPNLELLKVRRTKRDDHIKPLTQYSEQHVGVHKQSRRFQIRLKKHNCLELM
jgi:hypothetical protein